MRTLENRSRANGEVFLALVAAVKSALARCNAFAQSARRTTRALRPEAAFKVQPGAFLIREHFEKLESGNGAFGHGSRVG
jgi:hypothetical protein